MSFRFGLLAAASAFVAVASPASADFSVNFTGLTGQANPLTVGAASFDSSAGAGTFSVASTAGLFTGFLTGLGDFSSFSGDPLTITFASPVYSGVALTFGIEDAFGLSGNDTLTLTTNTGVTMTATGAPNTLALAEPEGTATIYDPGFTSVTITSANPFAIGSVVSAPEPMTLSILGLGLAGLAGIRRRA